jgi:predicted transcriptional regulator
MNETTDSTYEVLLEFFKALADANRLKMIGYLAERPRSVGELAELLGLSVSTTSHHLSYLAYVELVSARAEGHYYIYSLHTEKLRTMAQTLNTQLTSAPRNEPVQGDVFERKVLKSFTDAEGHIKSFPAQEKKLLVLLRHALKAFEPGKRYSEKEVNQILLRFNEDTAFLRRSFIEYKMMEREGGGGAYWLIEA